MFKNFTDDWGNRNSPVIVKVALISIPILNNGYNRSPLKLTWDKAMLQHPIEETLKTHEQRKWRVENMFSMNG